MAHVVEIDRAHREVIIVAHAPFGGMIARPVDAEHPRDLLWLQVGSTRAEHLVCGPSFLTLLEVFPEGELPRETAAVIASFVASARGMSPSLQHLRFDVDDRVFRWTKTFPRRADGTMNGRPEWRRELSARLIGTKRPSFERLFAPTSMRDASVLADADDDDELDHEDLSAGRSHLAGIVDATIGDRVHAAIAQREQWWLHDGEKPLGEQPSASTWKAEQLFADAELDVAFDRVGAARMNAKLATIYDPNRPRYRRALAALDRK